MARRIKWGGRKQNGKGEGITSSVEKSLVLVKCDHFSQHSYLTAGVTLSLTPGAVAENGVDFLGSGLPGTVLDAFLDVVLGRAANKSWRGVSHNSVVKAGHPNFFLKFCFWEQRNHSLKSLKQLKSLAQPEIGRVKADKGEEWRSTTVTQLPGTSWLSATSRTP